MRNNIDKSILAIFLIFCSIMVSAQQPPDPLADQTGAPIDDGIYILIILAVIYGIFKYIKTKRLLKT